MEKDLLTAKQLLEQNNCTCALCQEDAVFTSTLRGVKPLLNFLEAGTNLQGFCAADKVVGKGAAFLYCLLGVRAVYAPVMSQAALEVLQKHGIVARYDLLVDAIFNRRRDGFCPMETATKALDDPHEALLAIRKTLEKMHQS